MSFRGNSIRIGASIYRNDANVWTDNGIHHSENFLKLDELALILLARIKDVSSPTDSIIDICCGPGRHLNNLAESGYQSLHGFDIMRPSIANSAIHFPLLKDADLRLGNIVDILPKYADSSFDWAITHTATIENVHPCFPVHEHLFRVIRKGCIFLLNTTSHSYPRNYQYLFESAGFITVSRRSIPYFKGQPISLFTWIKPSYLNEIVTLN